MKFTAVMVSLFGVIVCLGGLIGYLTAESLPSLVAGAVFGAGLFASGLGIYRSSVLAFFTAIGLSVLLALFFGYRYYLTGKVMPSGALAVVSAIILLLLLTTKGRPHKKAF